MPDGRAIPLIEANDAVAHIRAGRIAEAAAIIEATDGGGVPREEALLWVAEDGVLSSALEAKRLPLQDYWNMLAELIQLQGSSSDPSKEAEDVAGQ